MKKNFQLIIFIGLANIVIGQNCLPEGISFNSQEDLDIFLTNYPDCTQIEGYVYIDGFQSNITDLSGLINITSIGGDLYISNTSELSTLTGLDNLESVQGSMKIGDNDGSQMGNYNLGSLGALASLTHIGGDLEISHSPYLANVHGLANLSHIGGGLSINNNTSLFDITSLSGINSLSGHLAIYDNYSLEHLNGLEHLSSIGEGLIIRSNASLYTLNNLVTLSSIGGDLYISFNGLLEDLDGLSNVDAIGGQIIININNVLSNIEGITNVNVSSVSGLTITNNSMLSDCAVKSVCDYISSTGAIVNIENNLGDCESQQQIEDACESISVQENVSIGKIKLYYNFSERRIFILDCKTSNHIRIYSIAGQELMTQKPVNNTIDVASLEHGVYIIEMVIDNQFVRCKVII